jgi:peptidyl-prolyl cis-trans isomerase A (cyclophilin A)
MKNKIIAITALVVSLLVLFLVVFNNKKEAQQNTEVLAYENLENNVNNIMNTKEEYTIVTFKTNLGSFDIELWNTKAPVTVENFLNLASNGFYEGVRFHRVIEGFMIQGGDPLTKDVSQLNRWGTGGPGYVFDDEIHSENRNAPGTISMANAGPGTNGSQFFINVNDNSYLDEKHTVFGKVISGYDVIEKISLVDTVPGADRPVEDVVIEHITIK